MPDDPTGSVTQFFHQLRAGDEAAARGLWQRFFPRLVALARKSLAGRPQRAADAEDAVISAFTSFWKHADDFAVVLNRDNLWKLLGTITVRKAIKQTRREAAEKRGGGRIIGETALTRADGSPLPLDEVAGQLPAQEFDLHLAELLDTLEPELRTIAVFRLLGNTNREIADSLGCTERKIERKLQLIRLQWEADWPVP
jgi:RNA polymerase sigma factor (sigma-70 family)